MHFNVSSTIRVRLNRLFWLVISEHSGNFTMIEPKLNG